jgi:D-galactarolactone cycloisomerase
MKIIDVKSHVLQYPLEKELGYSQMYFDRRTAHIVEVVTDEGIHGYGEAFGGGQVALANLWAKIKKGKAAGGTSC